ncbi:HD domain-containing protein [Zophobihabitans entericus]|uniref:HD domain-containing protein n=1 Tax=Zophobihabitans entericus TaxID=1635327 RepID=A0A6G9IEP7_9GAMM|nr:HD domain-containing protein [Zophobihabitans entericus]QIQ22279.1 HD domain-containing protein [Zophobihabitans entericus]
MSNYQLSSKQQQIIEQTQKFVTEKLAHDTSGHDFAHIQRVVNLARQILNTEPASDPFIVLMSAYLHDVIDTKVIADVIQAKAELRDFLADNQVPLTDTQKIFDIIENMSYSKNLESKKVLSLDGQIVQDADRLDALGAIGIGRTFYYGGHKKNIMYNPDIAPRTSLTEQNYRQENTVINHFYEKLFLLKDMMNTEEGKRIASKRHQILVDFVQAFENEWRGKI